MENNVMTDKSSDVVATDDKITNQQQKGITIDNKPMTNGMMEQYWGEVLRADEILYARKGDYENAIKMAEFMLETAEEIVEPDPSYISSSLLTLADLYFIQGQHVKTESLLKRAVEITEHHYIPDGAELPRILSALGKLYYKQGRYDLAEPLFERAGYINADLVYWDHFHMVDNLLDRGKLYQAKGQYKKSESLFSQALKLNEINDNNYRDQHEEIESLLKSVREIVDKPREPIHSEVVAKPNNQPDIQTENKPPFPRGTKVRFNKEAFLAKISEKPKINILATQVS